MQSSVAPVKWRRNSFAGAGTPASVDGAATKRSQKTAI